jgi:hypothetical protein
LYQRNLSFIELAVPIHLLLALLAWHKHSVAASTAHRDTTFA